MKIVRYRTHAAILISVCCMNMNLSGQLEQRGSDEPINREFTPFSLDEAPIPAYDFQRANRLPMTGYMGKTFPVNGSIRTARFYIAATAPVRSFFTVIALPEGYNTTEFLVASGWHDMADENQEGLVLLEPGPGGWGAPEMEQDYIDSVMNFYGRNDYFSIFGISYLVGYEGGGTALEAWAAANPLMVIWEVFPPT